MLFSMSLNFKQMALYYAPAFFFFLLASCLVRGAGAAARGSETGEFFFGACFFSPWNCEGPNLVLPALPKEL